MAERFKITNTTVKPAPKGVDNRTLKDKVGHFLQFEDERGRSIMLAPGKFAVIGYINEWFVENEKKEELKIDPIKDMGSALDAYRLQHQAEEPAKKVEAPSKVKAVEMGADKPVETEGTNPDGEPNFVVKAARK